MIGNPPYVRQETLSDFKTYFQQNYFVYHGFDTHLIPATSNCYEIGARGFLGEKFVYDLCGFYMSTKNDLFRFKQTGRGNQEVFYGNAGNSRRYRIESSISVMINKYLSWQTLIPLPILSILPRASIQYIRIRTMCSQLPRRQDSGCPILQSINCIPKLYIH